MARFQGSRMVRPAAVLLAMAVGAGLTACTPASTTSAGGGGGTPIVGDTLTIAQSAGPNSLDPGLINEALSTYTMLAYDSLTYLGSDGTVRPALAESWTYVGAGNKQFDLTIRSGVTFADGSAVTADAVKASLQHAMKSAGPQAISLASVTSITTSGNTVSLKLSAPNPELPQALDQYSGIGQIISPAGLADPAALTVQHPSQGAGAYVLDPADTVANDHYTYTANPTFYDKSRQHYKKIVLRVIANPQAVVNALKTGQIDAVIGGDVSVASQVAAAGARTSAVPFVFQGLNLLDRQGTVVKALGDVRVRQAINYALDRDTITKAVLGTYGVPTTQTVVQGADGYSEDAATRYDYNIDQARTLLAAAGYANGFTLPVVSLTFAGIDTMAQAIQGQLAKVGIKVTLKTDSDPQTYVTDSTSGKYAATAIGYGAQSVFAEGQGLFLPTSPVFNGFHTNDPKLVALYDQAAAASSDQRAALDKQIVQYLVDQAWFAPVAFSPVMYYSSASIDGLKVSGGNPIPCPLDWYETK